MGLSHPDAPRVQARYVPIPKRYAGRDTSGPDFEVTPGRQVRDRACDP